MSGSHSVGSLNGFLRTMIKASHAAFAGELPVRPVVYKLYRRCWTLVDTDAAFIAPVIGNKGL